MITTFVINLARSTDRRGMIEARLTELQIPFVFFPGVDGEKLTSEQRGSYSPKAAFAHIGREMHPNEIGCILSHIGIWQNLVSSGEKAALVVEDDMLIDADFAALVRDLTWIPADASVVNFSWDMAKPVDLQPISSKRWICRFETPAMRTGSYFIRKRAAEQLLKNAFPIRMPVDSLMGDERNIGKIYGVTPLPVHWDDTLPSATWTDASMHNFTKSSRRSAKGFFFRIMQRVIGGSTESAR